MDLVQAIKDEFGYFDSEFTLINNASQIRFVTYPSYRFPHHEPFTFLVYKAYNTPNEIIWGDIRNHMNQGIETGRFPNANNPYPYYIFKEGWIDENVYVFLCVAERLGLVSFVHDPNYRDITSEVIHNAVTQVIYIARGYGVAEPILYYILRFSPATPPEQKIRSITNRLYEVCHAVQQQIIGNRSFRSAREIASTFEKLEEPTLVWNIGRLRSYVDVYLAGENRTREEFFEITRLCEYHITLDRTVRENSQSWQARYYFDKEVIERAEDLLKSHLSDSQLKQYLNDKTFICIGSETGKTYVVQPKKQVNVVELNKKGTVQRKLCAVPDENIPIPDQQLELKLLIENDESEFLRVAIAW